VDLAGWLQTLSRSRRAALSAAAVVVEVSDAAARKRTLREDPSTKDFTKSGSEKTLLFHVCGALLIAFPFF